MNKVPGGTLHRYALEYYAGSFFSPHTLSPAMNFSHLTTFYDFQMSFCMRVLFILFFIVSKIPNIRSHPQKMNNKSINYE